METPRAPQPGHTVPSLLGRVFTSALSIRGRTAHPATPRAFGATARHGPMRRPIRQSLLVVAVLGVFTAALSAVALYRAIGASNAQRVERAREAVAEEVARLAAVGPQALAAPPTMVGLRGGLAADPVEIGDGVPVDWPPALA